jgi:hypothetical protein
MKNKLERFVNEHRDSFDSELPAGDVWDAVDITPRPKGKIIAFFTRTRVAVSLLLLINAAIIFVLLERKPASTVTATPAHAATEQAPDNNKENISEHTLEQISKVVEVKQAALKEIKSANPLLYKKFTGAWKELNIVYKELEKELGTHPNKEELLEAMIQNLSLQQELLNQQLSIYQKVKQQKNEKINKNI